MKLYRQGTGKPLLLVHGLGSARHTWTPILDTLTASREVLTCDLPGHGENPPEADSGTFAGITRSFIEFMDREGLAGVDMVGSSLGGRLVLELAKQGRTGAVVALDPGGFWAGWERGFIRTSLMASAWALRGLSATLPTLTHLAPTRSALLMQLSAKPWALDGDLIEAELGGMARTRSLDALIEDLTAGPMQDGPAAPGSGPVTIGWGRKDRLCLPVQAGRAIEAFPNARLHWFEESGHFPMWDQPAETAALILEATG